MKSVVGSRFTPHTAMEPRGQIVIAYAQYDNKQGEDLYSWPGIYTIIIGGI